MDSKEKIEFIFRNSVSSNELFDSFQDALKHNIRDCELYKIFLSNPTLSADEIKMYVEKLVKDFPEFSFELMMWVAELFENFRSDYEQLEESIYYFFRAFSIDKTNSAPLLKIISLYNYDIDIPVNNKILSLVEEGVVSVHKKSSVYYSLSDLYTRIGNNDLGIKYYALAEKSAEREGE